MAFFFQATGQTSTLPAQYKLTLDTDGTYKVWLKSLNTYTGTNARIGTAQVSLVVPTGSGASQFTVSNLTGNNGMTWNTSSQTRLNNPSVSGTPTNKDYIVFGFTQPGNVLFDITANTEILLFSFKNSNTCTGPVALWDTSNPLQVPNADNFNVGNQITIFGAGFGNKWHSNYGTSPIPCNTPTAPDLQVTVTPPATITQNTPAVFSVNVSNVGTGPTTGTTTVTTPIPSGMTYVSSAGTGWTCSQVTTDVVCTNPNPIAASASSPFTMTFNPTQTGSSSIASTVSGGGDATPSTSPTQNLTINPATTGCLIEYKITTEADGSYKVWMKSNTTFTGTAATIGTAQVTVVFPFPSGGATPVISNLTGFNSMTWTTGTTQQVQQGSFYYVVFNFNQSTSPTVFNITAGQEIPLFTFKNTATCNGPVSLWATTDAFQVPNTLNFNVGNQISVSGAGVGNKWCGNYGNAAACAVVASPNITVSTTAPTTATVGTPVTVNVNVSNTGTGATTTPISVSTPIPACMTYTSSTGTGWTCGVQSTNVVCTYSSALAANTSAPLGIVFTPTQTCTTTISTTTSGGGLTTPVVSTTQPIVVSPSPTPVVGITLTAPATATQNVPYSYMATVSNTGTASTTGTLVVTLPLPSGVNLVSGNGSGWSCVPQGTSAICSSTTSLTSGASSTINISVNPTITGTVNTFAFTSGGGANTASSGLVSTVISGTTSPNIVVSSSNPSTATVGTPFSQNITISNIGTGAATGPLTYTTTLPVGVNFSSVNSGWTCTQVSQTLTCTNPISLAAGASTPLNLQLVATAPVNYTPSGTLSGNGVTNGSLTGTPITITSGTGQPCTATDCNTGVRYGIKLGADGRTYTVYMKSATAFTGGAARIGTAQVTLKAPHGTGLNRFIPTNIVGFASTGSMTWTTNNSSRVDAPSVDVNNDYIFFGFSQASSPALFDIQANVEYPLFSFQNQNTCSGTVALWETTDPFQAGFMSLNPGNQMTILGNGTANAWKCNYTCTLPCQPPVDLTISATQPSPTLSVGQTSTINVTVTNLATLAATGQITVTTTLPTGVSTPSTPFTVGTWSCSTAGQVVTCTNPNAAGLAQNGTLSFALPVVPSANTAGQILTFNFNVTTTGTDSNLNNNSTSVTTTSAVTAPNLTVSMPNFVLNAGQSSNVTVNYANIGTATANGALTINVTIPGGATAPASFTSNGWSCTTTGQSITCTTPNSSGLAPNASGSIIIPVTTPSNALGGQSVTISATITPVSGEGITSDNTTTGVGQVVSGPNLKLIKSASAVATQGVPFDFTFTVYNIGGTSSSGTITVRDTLKSGLKYVSSLGTGWSCSKIGVDTQNNDIVECTTSTVHLANAGNSSSFTMKVNPTQAVTATNIAYMTGGGSTSTVPIPSSPCTNCSAGLTGVFVQASPDLTITIQQPNPNLIAGQPSTITLIVTNTGGATAVGSITANFTLPVGMTAPITFTSGSWTCVTSGQTVTCTNPNGSGLNAGGTSTLNINVTPSITLVGTTPTLIVNVQTIAVESNTSNNNFTLVVINPVAAPIIPDLAITLGQPTSNLIVGQQSLLPVTITNLGSGAASGQLSVSITIPTGITVPATFNSGGWSFTLSGNILTGTNPNSTGLSSNGTSSFQIPITPTSLAVNTFPIFFGTVNPLNTEINLANNTSFVISAIGVSNPSTPNMVISIVQPNTFIVNQPTNLVINVSNTGTANASGLLTMSLTMPAGMTAPASFTSGAWNCTTSGQTVNCSNLNTSGVAVGGQLSITIPVTPNSTLSGLIPGVFLASINQVPNEIVLIDNTTFYVPNSVVTNGGTANIVVTVSQPTPSLVIGQTSIINVNVLNNGTASTTSNTTINIVLPSTLSVPASFTSNGWSCTSSVTAVPNTTVSCVYSGTIAPNTSTNINISVTPLANTGGQNPGSITIIINGTPVQQPIILIGTIASTAVPDLMITMLQPMSPLQANQVGYIPVIVTNVGATTVTSPLSVTVTLPTGISAPSSFIQGAWSCTTTGQNVTCTNSNTLGLAATGQVSFWLPVQPSNIIVNSTPTFTASVNIISNEIVVVNNQTTMTTIIPVQGVVILPTLIPDLSITLGQPQPNFVVGQTSTINVVVANVGQGSASGQLTVTLPVPAGMTVAAGTSNGWTITLNGSTIMATHPNTSGLASGANLTFSLNVTPSSTVVNTMPVFVATVNMVSNETNGLNNTAMLISSVGVVSAGSPNLSITAVLGSPFIVNQASNFNVTVLNSGTVTANGQLTVTITLPSGMSAPISFTNSGWVGTTSGQTVTLTFANPTGLVSGGSLIFQVPVTPSTTLVNIVPPTFIFNVTQLSNEVVFIDNTYYFIPTAPVLSVSGPNIFVNVVSISPSLTVGQTSNITINFQNTGTIIQTGTQTINIVIPSGLSVPSSFTTANGWSCTMVGQTLTCTNPNTSGIIPNGNINLIIPVIPNSGTGGTILSPLNIFVNGSTTPIIYTFTTPIAGSVAPNLTVNVISMPTQMVVGQTYYIPVTITNIGTATATGQLTATFTLPNGMSSMTSFTQAGWSCSTSGQTVTCTNINTSGMAVGSSSILMIPITPSSILVGTTPSITINVLPVSGEIITTNNTFIYIITPAIISSGTPDLSIQVSQPSPALTVNQTSNVTITVQNVGTAVANGQLTVSFAIPANFTTAASPFTSGAWTCNVAGQVITCTNPNTTGFAVGSTSLLTVQLRPNSTAVGTTFTSTVSVAAIVGEVSLTNNTALLIVSTPVAPDPATLPSLNLVLSYNQSATYNQNVPFNYSYLVYNSSSSATTTGIISVVDTLRSGLKFVSGTGAGWVISKIGVDAQGNDIVQATLNSILPSNASTVFTVSVNPTLPGTIYNQAHILGGGMTTYKASAPCINCQLIPTGPIIIGQALSFNVAVKAILQGPYVPSAGLMHDSLRVRNRIPLNNPYTTLSGFVQVGSGTETTTSSVLSVAGNNAIVDWVLIELRSASNPSQIVATKAGLIQRDGDVVNPIDGTSPLTFTTLSAGSYFVAIRHRNHLGAMSATPLAMAANSTTTLDLTNASQPAYKLSGVTTTNYPQYVSGNKAMLWAGNAVANNQVIFQGPNNDVDMIFFTIISDPLNTQVMSNFINFGYNSSDVNMDGKTVFQGPDNEVDIIFFNVLTHPENPGFLANFIIWQQIP